MIIKKVLDYLTEALDCYVGVQSPETGSQFVLIDQVGSGRRNQINTVSLAIQSYGATLLDAIQLNEKVERAMRGELIKDPYVASVRLETDYNFTDTETKTYRWQAVYDITYYHQEV